MSNSSETRSVFWSGPASKDGCLRLLDQRELPQKFDFMDCKTVDSVADAIFTMAVRGAPAIGAAGGFGMAIGAFASEAKDNDTLLKDLVSARKILNQARPTAVNLEWATGRIEELATMLSGKGMDACIIRRAVYDEAQALADDDIRINRAIGGFGAAVVPNKANILHHCNTGALATVGHGTAIGVIYSCQEQRKDIHVWVDETRPRLQGARLTAFELMRAKVPMHLIADNAAGHLMYEGKVDVIVFGADRVAANGDVVNKIGTYKIAVCGRENGVPVYACVPTPTIDLGIKTGREIVIENRTSKEVTHIGEECIAPEGCQVYNPAFDVTPYKYLTGIITEEGICYPPFFKSLAEAKITAEKRLRANWEVRVEEYLKR